MKSYPSVPGRGLLTRQSVELRLSYLFDLGHPIHTVRKSRLDCVSLQKNIESFIGGVEMPVGLVGPLSIQTEGNDLEVVHALVGTLEGALVASMNRGAKTISLAGGCKTLFFHQRMSRVPMFFFDDENHASLFTSWVESHFSEIKSVVESSSNHAELKEINPITDSEIVHLEFVYETGDAAGQNMTTSCTWLGLQWIETHFEKENNIPIVDYIIEGNGSSDKKVSQYLSTKGRGCRVSAQVEIPNEVIHQVLRTTAKNLMKCVSSSRKLAERIGMLHYNINVANAVAAIFVATGQDLASIHESSLGELTLRETQEGILFELLLPSLVIGTVGGGTHLSDRQEALTLMGCSGTGKIERFAQLIAGFSLALEISTYAAIVSGEFANAHEKLGRNRPVNWLKRSEIDESFILQTLFPESKVTTTGVQLSEFFNEKGILTLLSQKVCRKPIGFMSIELMNDDGFFSSMLKSKATDNEILKGLHLVASSVDQQLARLLIQSRTYLEYNHCHRKELWVCRWLHENGMQHVLKLHGLMENLEREIFLLVFERMDPKEFILDSENTPEVWTIKATQHVLKSISEIHLKSRNSVELMKLIPQFSSCEAESFYRHLAKIVEMDHAHRLEGSIEELAQRFFTQKPIDFFGWKCLVHNDFNPRNVGLSTSLQPLIYDWELAMIHYPQRDVIEFLSFVGSNFTDTELVDLLRYYERLCNHDKTISSLNWWKLYEHTLHELMLTRLSFYVVADSTIETKFAHKVMNQAFRLNQIIANIIDGLK